MQNCALNSKHTKFSCTTRTTQRPKHPKGRTLMHRWAPLLAASGAAAAGGLVATQAPLWGTSGKGSNPEPMMADVVPSRSQQLMRLRDNKVEKPYDVLIIGGGATGTGCAWDAATRGLRTALVEREDFASGTSSKSTKLVHGGVRYLEKAVMGADLGQFKLVYEALHERKVFLENAPHLSRPLPILMPCYKWWEVPYYWAGMKAYDLVAGRGNLIWSKYVGPTEATELMPTLATQLDGRALKGAIMYYDGQFDDSRMAVTMACSAAAAGAATLNYMEAAKIIKNDEGKVVGVKCRDRLTGEEVDVHARVVINATGPFLDGVRHLADPKAPQSVTASKGAHITLPGYLGSSTHGIIIPKTPDGRVVFLLPWQDHLVAGTTDSEHEVTNDLRTTEEEVSYILTTISNYLGMRITPADVLSSWSGIRPLPSSGASKAKDTQSVVRDHVIFMDDDGLLNVTGGKWTTFRRMAEEVIDAAVASGRLPMNIKPCITEHHPVMGATAFKKTTFAEVAQNFLAAHSTNGTVSTSTAGPISLSTLHHLVQSYGDRAPQILALAEKPGLSQPLVPGHPYIQAEVIYCVQNEYCMSAEDFLARRTRLAFLDVRAAQAAVPKVVALMAPLRNWDEQAKQQQIAAAEVFLNQTFTAGPEPTTVQPLQEPALIQA